MRILIILLTSLFLLTGCALMKNIREVQEGNVFYSRIPKIKIKIDPSLKYIDKPQYIFQDVSCQVHSDYHLFYNKEKRKGVMIMIHSIGGNCMYLGGSYKLTGSTGTDHDTEKFFSYWKDYDLPGEIRWVILSKKLNTSDALEILYFEPIDLDFSKLRPNCMKAVNILEPKIR